MFSQLVEMLNQFAEIEIETTTNFRGIVMLRDELVKAGFARNQADDISMLAEIRISGELTDDELHQLIDPLVIVATNLATAFRNAGFSEQNISNIGKNLSIEMG